MNRTQLLAHTAQAVNIAQDLHGETVLLDGQTITGIMAPPRVTLLIVDGGEEVEIEGQCAVKKSDLAALGISQPRRWSQLKHDGKTYAVAGYTQDPARGEYILQLANSRLTKVFP